MKETGKYASVCYNVSKNSRDVVNAYEVEDLQERARVQAIADTAAHYLKIPEKIGVYITETRRKNSFGVYGYMPISVKASDSRQCVILPQEAVSMLSDDELLAFIISEKSGKFSGRFTQAFMGIFIAVLIFVNIYLFYIAPVYVGIIVLVIWFFSVGFLDEYLEKSDALARDKKAAAITGNKSSLIKALNKLYEDKMPDTDAPSIMAPFAYKRVEALMNIKNIRDSFIKR